MTIWIHRCLLALALAACSCGPGVEPPAAFEVGANRVGYLWVSTELALGDVCLMLPEHLRRGERVSGLVLVDQAGGAWSDAPTADHLMADWILELGEWSGSLLDGVQGVPIPPGAERLSLRLRHPDGRLLAEGRLPVSEGRPVSEADDWEAAPWYQASGLFRLTGPLDGRMGNTQVSVGGVALEPFVESERGFIGRNTELPPGRQELLVVEGEREYRSFVHVIDVEGFPFRANVAQGELVEFELGVAGLEGLDEHARPRLDVSIWMDGPSEFSVRRSYPVAADPAGPGRVVIRDSVVAPAAGRLRVNGGLVPPAF